MKVTEQIDAMEVLGTNLFKYLVVSRVWACIMMLPFFAIAVDAVGLFGHYLAEYMNGEVSFKLYLKGFSKHY